MCEQLGLEKWHGGEGGSGDLGEWLGGTVGAVTAANSLVGSTANDQVGSAVLCHSV